MTKFDHSWEMSAEHKYLYVRPSVQDVTGEDWRLFFDQVLQNYTEKCLFMVLDVREIKEDIGISLFRDLMDLFCRNSTEDIRIAALSTDPCSPFLVKLMHAVAQSVQVDVSVELFTDRELAVKGMFKQSSK